MTSPFLEINSFCFLRELSQTLRAARSDFGVMFKCFCSKSKGSEPDNLPMVVSPDVGIRLYEVPIDLLGELVRKYVALICCLRLIAMEMGK